MYQEYNLLTPCYSGRELLFICFHKRLVLGSYTPSASPWFLKIITQEVFEINACCLFLDCVSTLNPCLLSHPRGAEMDKLEGDLKMPISPLNWAPQLCSLLSYLLWASQIQRGLIEESHLKKGKSEWKRDNPTKALRPKHKAVGTSSLPKIKSPIKTSKPTYPHAPIEGSI